MQSDRKSGTGRVSCAFGLLLGSLVSVARGAEGDDDIASKLAPYFPSTIWAIVSFVLVLFVIVKMLMPKIIGAMDDRARQIRESLDAAERARLDSETAMKRHQDDLEVARHQARAIIEEGKSDAERLRAKIVTDGQRESEEILARARREIELAKQAALDDLHRQSVELAFGLAGRLVQKTLEPSDHQQLIQEQIRSFQARN
jgi:F-type H+-transporting ATPase subunit b